MTNKQRSNAPRGHAISGLFVFVLICMFALLATTLTLVGIRAYRGVSAASAVSSERQIALSYVVNKLHTADQLGGVRVLDTEVGQALGLREEVEGEQYETRIYCLDGQLCEYYCEIDDEFDAEMGTALTATRELRVSIEAPNLLLVELVQPDGTIDAAHVNLRAREAIVP